MLQQRTSKPETGLQDGSLQHSMKKVSLLFQHIKVNEAYAPNLPDFDVLRHITQMDLDVYWCDSY